MRDKDWRRAVNFPSNAVHPVCEIGKLVNVTLVMIGRTVDAGRGCRLGTALPPISGPRVGKRTTPLGMRN